MIKRRVIFLLFVVGICLSSCTKEKPVCADYEGYEAAKNPDYRVTVESGHTFTYSWQTSSGTMGVDSVSDGFSEFTFKGNDHKWLKIDIELDTIGKVDISVFENDIINTRVVVSCYPDDKYSFDLDL